MSDEPEVVSESTTGNSPVGEEVGESAGESEESKSVEEGQVTE